MVHQMIQGENISILMAKVFLYKSRGDQFLYNRNWDLSWFWAGWQYWKKTGPNMSNFWRQFFFMFSWTETFIILLKDIVAFTLKSCLKWRWKKMNIFSYRVNYEFLIGYRTYLIVSCSTRDTSPHDLCII